MRTRDSPDSHRPKQSPQLCPERYRERVLAVVEDHELPLSLSELAAALADQTDPPKPLSTRGDADEDRVRLRLHHVDLPKLHNAGELEYDASRNVVAAQFEWESE